jgi:hypothetical protein
MIGNWEHRITTGCPTIVEIATGCLRASPHNVFAGVWCDCEDGVLCLRGRLSSYYHKQVAQEAVARVGGVIQVVNDIEVTVPRVQGDQAQPGILAPLEMPVYRGDSQQRI